ncbi:MAG: NAD-dependent DNA ligase LigA [Bacteroidota bacterium]
MLKTEPELAVIEELRAQLRYHEWKYYVQNAPVLSDFEYDQLYKKLEALEATYPAHITPDSPTQRVASDLASDLPTVTHLTPMLSLANSYNAEDLIEWDAQLKRIGSLDETTAIEYVVEPKFDGGSIALVYENDRLLRAATRGNGREGEEMTNNARAMKSIPLRANFAQKGIHKVELRGEVLIRKDVFKTVNAERIAANLPVFANARNAATGGLRMKSASDSAQRRMETFVYQLGFASTAAGDDALDTFHTHEASIRTLEQLGFKVPRPHTERKLCKNIQEVADFCAAFEAKREAYPYEVDGMVVKVNDLALQKEVGYTSHHPRWAIAYKFKAKQATSRLLHVEFQVGKIGSITPVAKIEPVPLAGVTVSSISLHNEDFIKSKDIRLGDMVLVERAGDVIPYIVKALEDLRDGSEQVIQFPERCPVCGTLLVRGENNAAWRCPNTATCAAQIVQRMVHHVSKDAMNIDGFGKSYIERFHQLGWLKNLADIYQLDYAAVAALEGFGKKSASNLEKAIEQAKQNPIHRLLHSLSIHHVGKKAAKLLAAEIQHLLDLQHWTLEDFTNIKDIGPVVAKNVIAFFRDEQQLQILQKMEALGVNFQQTEADRPIQVAADAPLAGKTILFTGALQNISRKSAQEKATAAGARNISAVSKKLDILVVGEKPGSKLKKAQVLGTVQVLSEAEFLNLI